MALGLWIWWWWYDGRIMTGKGKYTYTRQNFLEMRLISSMPVAVLRCLHCQKHFIAPQLLIAEDLCFFIVSTITGTGPVYGWDTGLSRVYRQPQPHIRHSSCYSPVRWTIQSLMAKSEDTPLGIRPLSHRIRSLQTAIRGLGITNTFLVELGVSNPLEGSTTTTQSTELKISTISTRLSYRRDTAFFASRCHPPRWLMSRQCCFIAGI